MDNNCNIEHKGPFIVKNLQTGETIEVDRETLISMIPILRAENRGDLVEN